MSHTSATCAVIFISLSQPWQPIGQFVKEADTSIVGIIDVFVPNKGQPIFRGDVIIQTPGVPYHGD